MAYCRGSAARLGRASPRTLATPGASVAACPSGARAGACSAAAGRRGRDDRSNPPAPTSPGGPAARFGGPPAGSPVPGRPARGGTRRAAARRRGVPSGRDPRAGPAGAPPGRARRRRRSGLRVPARRRAPGGARPGAGGRVRPARRRSRTAAASAPTAPGGRRLAGAAASWPATAPVPPACWRRIARTAAPTSSCGSRPAPAERGFAHLPAADAVAAAGLTEREADVLVLLLRGLHHAGRRRRGSASPRARRAPTAAPCCASWAPATGGRCAPASSPAPPALRLSRSCARLRGLSRRRRQLCREMGRGAASARGPYLRAGRRADYGGHEARAGCRQGVADADADPGPLRGREGAGPRAHAQGAGHRGHALRHRRGAPHPGRGRRRRRRDDAPGAVPGRPRRVPARAGDRRRSPCTAAGRTGASRSAPATSRCWPTAAPPRCSTPRPGERRPTTRDDWRAATRLLDALDDVGFYWCPTDYAPDYEQPGGFVRYFTDVFGTFGKHVQDSFGTPELAPWLKEVLDIVFGGPDAGARAHAAVVPHHAGVAADHRARLHADLARAARLRPAGRGDADAAAGRHGARQPSRHAAGRQLRDHRHAVPRAGGGAGHAGVLRPRDRDHGPAHGPLRRRRDRARGALRRRHRDGPLLRPAGRVLGPLHADLRARPADRVGEGGRAACSWRCPTRTCWSARACSAARRSSASSRSSWTSRSSGTPARRATGVPVRDDLWLDEVLDRVGPCGSFLGERSTRDRRARRRVATQRLRRAGQLGRVAGGGRRRARVPPRASASRERPRRPGLAAVQRRPGGGPRGAAAPRRRRLLTSPSAHARPTAGAAARRGAAVGPAAASEGLFESQGARRAGAPAAAGPHSPDRPSGVGERRTFGAPLVDRPSALSPRARRRPGRSAAWGRSTWTSAA